MLPQWQESCVQYDTYTTCLHNQKFDNTVRMQYAYIYIQITEDLFLIDHDIQLQSAKPSWWNKEGAV